MTPEQNVVQWARSIVGSGFVWGVTDCAMIALVGLSLFTGKDYSSAYLGQWSNETEALAHFDVETPSDVLRSFGAVNVPPSSAVIGDVVTVPGKKWPEMMHFVLGSRCISSSPETGVQLFQASAVTGLPGALVWRVA